jgi:hypothetical protein
LKSSHTRGIVALIADLGLGALYLVWTIKAVGRFAGSGRSGDRYWFPYCLGSTMAAALPLWYKLANLYEAVAIFLILQVPLALLKGNTEVKRSAPVRRWGDAYRQRVLQRNPDAEESTVVGPLPFLWGLLLIAALGALLIHIRLLARGGAGQWFVSTGYFVLACAWVVILTGRFKDAGWNLEWRTSQFCLVVSVTSLMPLAFRWVDGYGSLAIFVLIQIPILFLRTRRTKEAEA